MIKAFNIFMWAQKPLFEETKIVEKSTAKFLLPWLIGEHRGQGAVIHCRLKWISENAEFHLIGALSKAIMSNNIMKEPGQLA